MKHHASAPGLAACDVRPGAPCAQSPYPHIPPNFPLNQARAQSVHTDSCNQHQSPDKSTGPQAPEPHGDSYRLTPVPPLNFPAASLDPPCRSDRSVLKSTCYGRCNFQSDGCHCPNSRGTATLSDLLSGEGRIQPDASASVTQEQNLDLQQQQQQHDRTPARTTSSTLSQPQSFTHGTDIYPNLLGIESLPQQGAFAGLPSVSTGALLQSNTMQKRNKCLQQAYTDMAESPASKFADAMQCDVGGANANPQLDDMEMTSMSSDSFESAIERAYNSRPSIELVKKQTSSVELTRKSLEDAKVSPAKRRRNEEHSPSVSPSLSSDWKELDEILPSSCRAHTAPSDWKNEEVKFIAAVDIPYGHQINLQQLDAWGTNDEKMASKLSRLKSDVKTIDNLNRMTMCHDLFAPQSNLIAMTAEIPSSTVEMESIVINASNAPLETDKASRVSDNDDVWHASLESPQGSDFPTDNNSLPNSLDSKKEKLRDQRNGNEINVSPSNRNSSPFAAVARSTGSNSPFTAKRINFDGAYNLMEDSLSEVDPVINNDRGHTFISRGTSSNYKTKSDEKNSNHEIGSVGGSSHDEMKSSNINQQHTPASARYLRPNTPLSKHHSASSSRSGTPMRKSPRIPAPIELSENVKFPPAPRRPSIQISITRHPSHDTLIYLKDEADDIPSEADDIPSDSEAIPTESEADDIPSEEQTVTNSSSRSNSALTTPNIRRASLRKTNTLSAQLHKLQQSALKELQSLPIPSSTAIAPQPRPPQSAPQIQHPFLKNRQDDIPSFFTKRRANPDIADWLSRATNTQKPNNLSAMLLHTREFKTLLRYISPAVSGPGASTGKPCTVVLHGPAWSGKTFTAKFLFDKVKADTIAASLPSTQAREFLWVSCATYESLGKSLRDIFLARGMDVSKSGAGSVEHLCSKFSSWFAGLNKDQIASNGAGGGYLLVLDGVNNVHVLEALLGKCEQRWAGHVFVTATLLEDRVMSFIKGNSGDVALVPMGPVSDADVKNLLVGRGAEGEWVNQLPRFFGGVATRPLLFKRHMVTHKMAGSKLFDIAERRRREALPESLTRTNFVKAMLDYSMESLIARHGWFGEACIAVLELMSVVSGPGFSLTLESANAMLGLQPGDFVLKEIFKLIEARGLIVKLEEIASQQFTFCVASEIHEMMLEHRCMTMVSLKCVHDALTSLLQSSLADESDSAMRTYAVERYFYGCSNLLCYLEKQLGRMHHTNQVEDQASLDYIIRTCTKLGLSLFKEKKFYQSVQCFKLVAGFSKLELSLCKDTKQNASLNKFLELVHDLIGCVATELVTATAAAAVGPNSAAVVQQPTAQPTSKPLARRTSTISATGSTSALSAAVQPTEPLKQPFSKRLQQQLLQKEKEATQRDTLKFAAPAVSSIDLMFAIMIQPGLERPFEYAESALKDSLEFIHEVYRGPEDVCTVQEARQQLHLAYLHAQWSLTLAQAHNSINASITGNSTSTQKTTEFQRHATSFKHYAVCAANTLTNVYGCDAHVDVIGILAICATAYIMDGDRMMAWNYVRRCLRALERVFGVTIETAFEVSAEPNQMKKKGGNGFTRAFEEASVHWIVKEMLSVKYGLNLGEAMGGKLSGNPLGVEDAKRLYRKLLLAAEELRDLQCGPIFQSFVCRYDIQDPEESAASSERTEIVLEEVPSEASDIDESDEEEGVERTPTEALNQMHLHPLLSISVRTVEAISEFESHENGEEDSDEIQCEDSISCVQVQEQETTRPAKASYPVHESDNTVTEDFLLSHIEQALREDVSTSMIQRTDSSCIESEDDRLVEAVAHALAVTEQPSNSDSLYNLLESHAFPSIYSPSQSALAPLNTQRFVTTPTVSSTSSPASVQNRSPWHSDSVQHNQQENMARIHASYSKPRSYIPNVYSSPPKPYTGAGRIGGMAGSYGRPNSNSGQPHTKPTLKTPQPTHVTYAVPKIEYDSFISRDEEDTFIERVSAPVYAKYQ
ncbi:hypothetical protein HDU77_008612 [Chytriomyces hyalinus]|nr:hypothetical protein HDU77_008612 [Chytriomyces hyalinus]